MKESAHVAYDAYGDFVEWKNFAGNPMPKWEDLPEKIQNAWRAATGALGGDDRLDQAIVQLAGCSVAALGCGTSEEEAAKESDWGWSPAYADVLKLRRAFDKISGGRAPDEVLATP